MPKQVRNKTRYAGVYWIEGRAPNTKQPERIYYITYRRDGKRIEEKAGRQVKDKMTPAKASGIRADRIQGKESSNKARREAEAAARKAETAKWTIDRLWEKYKEARALNKSLKTDDCRYQKYLEKPFGGKEPQEIILLDVERLKIKLLKNLSPQTVKHVLSLLKRIGNFGKKQSLCKGLQIHIPEIRVNNTRTEDLTQDQLKALLKAIDEAGHIQAANLMKMALLTGMRRGELFKLKWDDIDFERGFIHIRDPKGVQDQIIPLNEGAENVFLAHPKTGSEYVFPGRGGGRRVDINHQVNEIKEKANLPKNFRPLHGLRHVYASMLASSGKVDMYTLQKLLTHKDPRMTQRYAHLRDETLKRASSLAGDLIEKAFSNAQRKKSTAIRQN